LWQETQFPLTPAWSKRVAVQEVVVWQVSHPAVVAMWLADLPRAVVPL